MEFEGQYLSYDDFRTLGGTLDLTPFNLLEFEARRKIDIRTQNRLKDLEKVPQEVKLCEYKLITTINDYIVASESIASNGNVASENTDGYSISYVTADRISEISKSKDEELTNIIREYLLEVIINGEHIMYLGVDNGRKPFYDYKL